MSKDLWLAEVDRVGEDFADGRITRDEAEAELKRLGFDPQEIADQLDEIDPGETQ